MLPLTFVALALLVFDPFAVTKPLREAPFMNETSDGKQVFRVFVSCFGVRCGLLMRICWEVRYRYYHSAVLYSTVLLYMQYYV